MPPTSLQITAQNLPEPPQNATAFRLFRNLHFWLRVGLPAPEGLNSGSLLDDLFSFHLSLFREAEERAGERRREILEFGFWNFLGIYFLDFIVAQFPLKIFFSFS